MTTPLKTYEGILRAKVTILDLEKAQIEWINPEGIIVWTETVKPKAGYSFMSQIVCRGQFHTEPGCFVDSEGRRHFVMKCDPGQLGVLGTNINVGRPQ